MKLTPLGIAVAAALGLAACSGSDDAPKTDAAADTASETAATSPGTSMPSDPAVPVVDGAPPPADPAGPLVTPPTLPTDPTMEPTSQATASPPPR